MDQTAEVLQALIELVDAERQANHFGPVIPTDLAQRQLRLQKAEQEFRRLAAIHIDSVHLLSDFIKAYSKKDVRFNWSEAFARRLGQQVF